MKITSFNPLIVSNNAEEIIRLFEEMGFVRRHRLVIKPGDTEVVTVRMKDPNGFYVDVVQADGMNRDLTLIRMNVDNFDEALKELEARGFRNTLGDKTVNTRTNKSALVVSPSGFAFDLFEHIKE